MLRDPRCDDQTACTAVASDFVFTVRTYGTGPFDGPPRQPSGLTGKPATAVRARPGPEHRDQAKQPVRTSPQQTAVSAQISSPKTSEPQVSATCDERPAWAGPREPAVSFPGS